MNREPPTLDMRPDGSFTEAAGAHRPAGGHPFGLPPPGRRPTVPLSAKLMLGGIVVAAVGFSIAVAVLAIWVVSLVLPVIIIGVAVAWAAMKYRRWQLLRGQPLSTRAPGGYPRQPPGGFR